MVVKLQCPACGRELVVPSEEANRPFLCNGCGARFFAPPGFSPYTLPPPVREVANRVVAEAPLAPEDPAEASPTIESPADLEAWPESPLPPPVPFVRRVLDSMDAAMWAGVIAAVLGVAVVILIICLVGSREPKAARDADAPPKPRIVFVEPPEPAPSTAPATQTQPATAPQPTQPASAPAAEPFHPRPQEVAHPASPEALLSDEQIGQAITRASGWLLNRFDLSAHQLRLDLGDDRHNALDALCVYALAQAGQETRDPRLDIRRPLMRGLLAKLDRLKMERRYENYGRAIRAIALSVYDRPEDQDALRDDVQWLLSVHKGGAYGYGDLPASQGGPWDHSNTQYGQLGVWAGEEAGVPVPTDYWQLVRDHWESTQAPDGSWSYTGSAANGTMSMTAAGLASLFVAHDRLDPPALADKVGESTCPPSVQNALDWCQQEGRVLRLDGQSRGYTLYGVERIGLASGMKFLGDLDWYRHHAADLVERQHPDGSWGDEVETCYDLLFLARGRHPVMINKLAFNGHWSNRWRDAANLTRFASRELERPLSWQVVPSDRDWTDWADAPILYLASHEAPKLEDEEIDNLRRFVEGGGLLFTHADGGRPQFNDFARALAKRLFPNHPLAPLPPSHPLFSILYHLDPPPPLEGVSNGVRLLMVHSPVDLSAGWHPQLAKTHPLELQTGVNLYLYASGREDLQHRLVEAFPSDPVTAAAGTLRVARLQYGDDEDDHRWDPEPMAWQRFARWFTHETGHHLDVTTVRATMLAGGDLPHVVHLTGTEPFYLPEPEVAALRRYVDDGGTLLVDAAGGSAAFADCARQFLRHTFPDVAWSGLLPSEPPLGATLNGMTDESAPVLRPFARQGGGTPIGSLESFSSGKGRVIFSPLDLTAGLLGSPAWGIRGFEPNDARGIVRNLLIWTAGGAPRPAVKVMESAQPNPK